MKDQPILLELLWRVVGLPDLVALTDPVFVLRPPQAFRRHAFVANVRGGVASAPTLGHRSLVKMMYQQGALCIYSPISPLLGPGGH